MSAQSAKKKRLGSRRRVGNQNEMSKTDDSHGTGSTFVAQHHIPEENTDSLNLLANFDNSHSEIQHPTSPELLRNRRKLGSRRRNKEQYVKDSVTESYHEPREEVDRTTRGLAIQPERQADASPDYSSEANCSEADLEGFSSISENLQADREENETDSEVISESCKFVKTMQEGIDNSDLHNEEVKESAHLVGISELTSLSVLSCPTVDQQLIDRSNCREKLPNVCSATENEGKERDDNTELFFSTTPERTTENTEMESSVQQGTIVSPKEELPTKVKQNEHFNLSEVTGAHHSEDAVNEVHEDEIMLTDMHEIAYSSDDTTENSEISGNLINQTEVCEKKQFELIVKNTDDSPTNRDDSNPDKLHEGYHVYDTKEPQISDIERVDTALSQVFEMEGRVQGDTKPSAEQTGQQEQEGLLSETEESASSLQTLQSEINVPFDSQPQPNDTSFNSIGSRRKLGSSRRNKGRQHVKDSAAESDHERTEDVVGEISDNETLETTEMTLIIETAVQEKSMETLLEETDKFDTAQTEDVTDHVKENAQHGTLVAIGNLNSSGSQSNSTVDQQTIEQSRFREMPDEEVPNVCSVTEKENKEIDEDTDCFRQDGNLQGKYLVSQDIESSITPEMTTEKHSSREHTEPECRVEQEIVSSPKEELQANEGQNKIFNLPKVKGDYHSEVAVNKLHEQDVEPTENQEMPQLDYSSENVIHDATENSEIISGNLMNQTEVSDTYQSELAVKNTDDSSTNRDNSIPDNIQDGHPTEENHFEASEQNNKDFDVYDTKEPQISDIERVDTGLSPVFEMEGRVQGDTKPSAEQTGQQEQEGLLSETEESASSLQTLQSEINVPFDSQPQPNDTSFNSIGSRRKLGSSRRNKGRQHVKDSVAESDHGHKEEDVESTRGNEAFDTVQMSLPIERTSHEELSQESQHDIMPATHDSSSYSAITPGNSSEVQSPTLKNYPEALLESLIPKSENLHEDHDERENDFKVEVSDRSVEATLEGADTSDALQSQEFRGDHHTWDAVNKLHEQDVEPTENQEMPKLDYSSESVTHTTEDSENISGNMRDETEVSDTYQSQLTVKNTDDSPTNRDNSNPDNVQDENVEALEWRHEDYHVYDTKEPQISDIERVDTALSQVFEMEGRVQGDTKPSAEQTGQQEQEGLLSETEESASSLQTLQSEINVPFDSQPQPNDTSFNSIGSRRKLGSSRRNKGRQHVKDSAAESDHERTEDVVGEISDNETLETTEMTLIIETAVQEKSMETLLEETDKFDTAQTEDVTDHVKENAQHGTLVAIGNLNSSGSQSNSTVDQQTIEQSHFREMPDEEVPNVCSVTEKENKEIDEDTDCFRQDGNLQGKYLVSQDIESSITPEMTTEKHSSREHTEPECSVEQEIVSSPNEELQANEGQNKIFNLPKVKGDYHSEVAVNKLHEQDVEPTENQEMPQLDYSSENVIHDATENSEIISGNLMNQTEVSDTYQSELAVKNTDDSSTNRDNSIPDNIQDGHPTEENHFEASEQNNKDFDVYDTKEPQISDIERVDTGLRPVFEMEGRVQGDTKPSAEQTGQQEQEGLLSETEESASSLQTLQSEINVPFDSQPQPNDTSFNSIGSRRKLGSSRRNKGRQHVKYSVAESDHGHKEEDVESTRGNEAFDTVQMSLPIERTSHEELSQERQHDIMPATHDSSSYSAITPGNSSEVQSPTLKNYPQAVLESLIPKGENLHEDHDERENDFKVQVSDRSVEATLEGADTSDALQSQEFRGDHHTWDAVNKLHEQDVEPTENQEMPKLDYSSESVTHTTEDSENISGNMRDETEVSDTYQSQLTVKNTDDSPTNRDNSNPDNIQDENVEALEWRHEDYHVYDTKEPQISDIERVDTALSQVFEMEGRVQGDTKPSAEQTGQQEQEGLLSETEESASSLQTLQSEINVPFDSQPQPNDTSFNSIGSRRKLGSSRRNKGRQHVKDSVAESDHGHKEEDVESTRGNEAFDTVQMSLPIERTSHEELSQESQHDIMPATHDSSSYSAITPGYSSEVQSPTLKNYPEAVLESLIPKSENLHEDHDERENDFKVEVSDRSVEATLEETDTFDALQSQEFRGDHHTWDAVNKLHEQDVEPTENQEMPQLDYSSENVIHDATENSEIISGNLMNQTEVSDTYQSELAVKNTDDSSTNRDNSIPDNIQDGHPTEENHFEASEQNNKDFDVYDTKEPQISDIERVDTGLSQVFEMEGRVQGDTKPSAEQTGQQEQEGLLSETEESASSLQTLQSEINVPFDSQPQPNDTSFNSIGSRRKLGSSRRNKGKQHVKDSVAESDHGHKEEDVESTGGNEAFDTVQMSLPIERTSHEELSQESQHDIMPATHDSSSYSAITPGYSSEVQSPTLKNYPEAVLESLIPKSENLHEDHDERENDFKVEVSDRSVEATLEETDTFDTAQTEDVTDQVKENAQDGTLAGIANLNSLGSQSSSTVDQQTIEQSNFREMPEEEVSNVRYETEKENEKRNEDTDWFRQDGNLQGKYLVTESHVKSEDIESSITLEINTEKSSCDGRNEIECDVEQADFSSSEEKLPTNEEQKERVNLSQVRGTWHSQEALNTVHEEEINPTQMQERHQTDNISIKDSESNSQKLQSEMNAPLDSQPLDNSQNITEQTHKGFNPTGNTTKLGSSQRNGRLHVEDATEMALVMETIQSSSYQDDVTARSNTSDEEFQVQNKEASNLDKETIIQQTNDTPETVGNVIIKDRKTGAESTMYVQVYEQDEDGAQFQDPAKKENEAQETNVSKEMFSAPHNKTDVTFDIGLKDETLRAEPAVDVSEESGISSQQGIQEKTHLDDSENLQGRSKQKRRKMGSTRRTQLNRKTEEDRVETKKNDREADMRNLDKMEVVEELTMIATAEVSQNENAKPSLSLVYKEQMETNETSTVDGMGQKLQSSDLQSNIMSDIDYSKALPPEQSGSHNEEVVDPVKFVHVADVSESKRNVDVSVEPSQIDEMHITSAFAGRNTNTGISGLVSLCETTQSTGNDEESPESVNIIQDQALKSTEALALADLEKVKSEEHVTAGASKQEPDNANEGAHNKNLEMKNASSYLDTSSRRRKMGSTRRNLRTGTKQEDLHQKQDVNDEATETATNVGDVRTESFSSIIKDELQLDGKHKDGNSETIEHSHSGESHKPLAHQTFEENPVSQGQLLETEQQLTPSDLPAMPSTPPKHDLISESASGGRRRKMGSHRKSHGHQNYENQTAGRDRITDTPNKREVRSIREESAIKTEELKEECLGLDAIVKVDKSHKKPFSNLSTSKEGEHPRPVSEKTPESVTPVQHHYAAHQQKLSLASRADLRSNVMMVGDSSVGKTSFMKRAQSGKFSLDIPASIGLDSCIWTVVVEGKPVVLQLWDTAGQERFHSLTKQMFHKADAFLLMYDVTSSQSFSAVSYWASCIQEGAAESVTILLVGNKSDQAERQVTTQEAEYLAKEYNFEFMECSAATGENVVQSLETVARMLSQKVDPRDDTMVLDKEPQPKTSRCC